MAKKKAKKRGSQVSSSTAADLKSNGLSSDGDEVTPVYQKQIGRRARKVNTGTKSKGGQGAMSDMGHMSGI
jgi:hypothetical protein